MLTVSPAVHAVNLVNISATITEISCFSYGLLFWRALYIITKQV